MLIDSEHVKRFLPHRDPFLFIDSVESVEMVKNLDREADKVYPTKDLVGGEVFCNYFTREDHPIFEGHFPGAPILPGVVQVEMMAQASSFLLIKSMSDPFNQKLDVALLLVNNAKFRKPVLPGMQLSIKAKCVKVRGPFFTHDCEIYHEDELMSQCTAMASVKFE